MSGKTVELESLQQAASALDRYIQDVQDSVNKLNTNIRQCQENMETDEYSKRAMNRLDAELSKIQNALGDAQETRGRIQRKIVEIQESETILG